MSSAASIETAGSVQPSPRDRLDEVVQTATRALLSQQQRDGHWVFELEADATIPAEYILLQHFLAEIDPALNQRLAVYLRRIQGAHGGWPLFHDGPFNISASVKAYYALKCVGDPIDAPHMVRARNAILAAGGAARSNVFTRICLALFGQVPWRAVPVMPVEIMLLPRWAPFHLDKVSYWSRTVMVPLLVLMALKPQARNPHGIHVSELFVRPPETEPVYLHNPTGSFIGNVFLAIDKVLQVVEPFFPTRLRARAIDKALGFIAERLNGKDGLGAIFPAMANVVMVYDTLGYGNDDPRMAIAKEALTRLIIDHDDTEATVQPCVSPIWDTGLAALALLEVGGEPAKAVAPALRWLADRQILRDDGDWAVKRPGLRGGGWAFQYANDHYPDVDDTAVVAMALDRGDAGQYAESLSRATEWILGMQSRGGGWGAFDADNTHFHLNHIPFADHGALLDPPTVDVTARCISMLAQLGRTMADPVIAEGVAYLRREQEADGSWFGRWGTNYIYGTWSALSALNAAGEPADSATVRRAVDWLLSRQQPDGGWGEDGGSYEDPNHPVKASTPSQTAWALLGLMAAGEVNNPAVARGVDFLTTAPRRDGLWQEEHYTAVGFPRVFYLRYHGYKAYFPLMALARYRNLLNGNSRTPLYGM